MTKQSFCVMSSNELTQPVDLWVQSEIKKQCPFVSKNGPKCKLCGADPEDVNLDPLGRWVIVTSVEEDLGYLT